MVPWTAGYAIRTRLCSPNTLFSFCFFSPERVPKELELGQFWKHVLFKKCFFVGKKETLETASKKGVPSESNQKFFTGQEAPGEAASRAHCSDKKQLFEQQLKHVSK